MWLIVTLSGRRSLVWIGWGGRGEGVGRVVTARRRRRGLRGMSNGRRLMWVWRGGWKTVIRCVWVAGVQTGTFVGGRVRITAFHTYIRGPLRPCGCDHPLELYYYGMSTVKRPPRTGLRGQLTA